MGYNTTVVVLNDALDQIAKDSDFGRKLYEACLRVWDKGPVDVSAGNHCNAATVIESHHADANVAVIVGGNMGEVLNPYFPESARVRPERIESTLRNLAEMYGYRLVKKRSR